MTQILVGSAANDNTGDPLRTAFLKVNQYGILNDKTVNAAFYKTSSNTIEAAITLAIVAAALLGTGAAVWVPQSMLPYNASLVTFNNAVFVTREGGRSDVADVLAYGAYADDGVHDDFASFNAAASFCANAVSVTTNAFLPRWIYAPDAYYRVSADIVLQHGVGLLMDAQGGHIGPHSSYVPGGSNLAIVRTVSPPNVVTPQQLAFVQGVKVVIDAANVNGILFDGIGQTSIIRDTIVSGGASCGYGIKIDSSNVGTGGPLSAGVRLDNVWSFNNGASAYPLIVNDSVQCVISNYHGEHMAAGFASVLLTKTNYINTGQHELLGIHHEAGAGHSSFIVDIGTGVSFCHLQNLYSTVADNTDIGVRMAAGSFGNAIEHLHFGSASRVSIQDNNSQASRSISSSHVQYYVQDASGLTTSTYGRSYGPSIRKRKLTANGAGGTYTPNASVADIHEVQWNGATGTIANPNANNPSEDGQVLIFRVFNNTAGAVTTTWGAVYKLMGGAWVDPGAGKSRTTNFYNDGTSLWEFGRASGDQ